MFYRAARLAQRGVRKRGSHQTWREWIAALPDPIRRYTILPALEISEKSRYGRVAVSSSEFQQLEKVFQKLKTARRTA